MGLPSGTYRLGEMEVAVDKEAHKATLVEGGSLAGRCVRHVLVPWVS